MPDEDRSLDLTSPAWLRPVIWTGSAQERVTCTYWGTGFTTPGGRPALVPSRLCQRPGAPSACCPGQYPADPESAAACEVRCCDEYGDHPFSHRYPRSRPRRLAGAAAPDALAGCGDSGRPVAGHSPQLPPGLVRVLGGALRLAGV